MHSITPWPKDRRIEAPNWTPPEGVRLISSDDHVMEIPHLWEERLKGPDKDRAPKFWRDDSGFHMTVEGESYDVPGLPAEFTEGREGFSDIEKRLADMDAEGVEASVVFHGRAAALIRMQDKQLFARCIDVFNEWMAEWRQPAPDRLFPVAYLPTFFEPEATRDYLQKLKALGFRAIEIPANPRGIRYNSSQMDPMWAAIEESGLPVSIHIGAYLQYCGRGSLGANLNANLMPFTGLYGLFVFSGLFDRFPGLKIVFTEGGAGWVAATLENANKVARDYATELRPKLAHKPSWYWHNNCYATFMEDPVAIEQIERIGADRIMWSVDYPHPESIVGSAMEVVQSIFDAVGPEKARKIVGGNAASVWNI
jgi:predicted TIM-barrel fold metal-dependent hydrolase